MKFQVRVKMLLHSLLLVLLCAAATAHASSLMLNFDSVDTSQSPGYVDSTAYLASYGITLTGVTPGTSIAILNDNAIYGGTALIPPSPPNILQQIGSNAPVSFTLQFATPLDSFGFTVPGDQSPSLFPAWQAYAFAGQTLMNSTGQSLSCCHGPLVFTLQGPNINSVRFDSQNFGIAGFSAVPLDNFVLTSSVDNLVTSSIPEPSSLLLLASGVATLVGLGRRRRNNSSHSHVLAN